MKITTLIAAAALATASTAATAQNVTTDAGELVIVEKNQFGASVALLASAAPAALASIVAIIAVAGGTR